ncbi:MAG: ubiquinol-cytochrome c reductase iron-sulfur subunit [Bacteroidota bacterium]
MAKITRKEFLKRSGTLAAGACALATVPACGLLDEPEMRVCTVGELEAAGTFVGKFNRKQIFLTYLDDELTIFSLVCTHKKCTVKWEENEELFACPCHEGTYDKLGRVIDGPPPRPLNRFKYEIRGEEIWVLNTFV